jgi:hypothetical protein
VTAYDDRVTHAVRNTYPDTKYTSRPADSQQFAALISATLAAAEQARIANLIAEQAALVDLISRSGLGVSDLGHERLTWLRIEIRQGLGGPQETDTTAEGSAS